MQELKNNDLLSVSTELPTETPVESVAQGLEGEPPRELSDEQKALFAYQTQLQKFANQLANYEGSRRALCTAWGNTAVYPFSHGELKFSYPIQEQLFNTFNELNAAKFMLMILGFAKDGKITINESLLQSPPKGAPTPEPVAEEVKEEGVLNVQSG